MSNPFPSTALRLAALAEDVGGFDAAGFADNFGKAFFVIYGVSAKGRAPPSRTNIVDTDAPRGMTANLEPFAVPIVRRANAQNEFVSVGRLDGNDICLADLSVSKFHALVREVEGTFFIQHGNSRNGTKVNGAHVGKRGERATALKNGDVVQLANVTVTFMDAGAVLELTLRGTGGEQ